MVVYRLIGPKAPAVGGSTPGSDSRLNHLESHVADRIRYQAQRIA